MFDIPISSVKIIMGSGLDSSRLPERHGAFVRIM